MTSSCGFYYLNISQNPSVFLLCFWSSFTDLHCPKHVILFAGSVFSHHFGLLSPTPSFDFSSNITSFRRPPQPSKIAHVPYFTFSEHCMPFLRMTCYGGKFRSLGFVFCLTWINSYLLDKWQIQWQYKLLPVFVSAQSVWLITFINKNLIIVVTIITSVFSIYYFPGTLLSSHDLYIISEKQMWRKYSSRTQFL